MDAVRIPEATTTFQCEAGSFEYDPFELWEAIQQIARQTTQDQKSDFDFWHAVQKHVLTVCQADISMKQAAWLAGNIERICLEKKSDFWPSTAVSAEPAVSTASQSSPYPTTSDVY